MLDFASAAALTLAVRRWTGTTPSGYRAATRAEGG
jgi:AraC-like DNA-binding protein